MDHRSRCSGLGGSFGVGEGDDDAASDGGPAKAAAAEEAAGGWGGEPTPLGTPAHEEEAVKTVRRPPVGGEREAAAKAPKEGSHAYDSTNGTRNTDE